MSVLCVVDVFYQLNSDMDNLSYADFFSWLFYVNIFEVHYVFIVNIPHSSFFNLDIVRNHLLIMWEKIISIYILCVACPYIIIETHFYQIFLKTQLLLPPLILIIIGHTRSFMDITPRKWSHIFILIILSCRYHKSSIFSNISEDHSLLSSMYVIFCIMRGHMLILWGQIAGIYIYIFWWFIIYITSNLAIINNT